MCTGLMLSSCLITFLHGLSAVQCQQAAWEHKRVSKICSVQALRAQGPSFPQALTDHFVTLMDGTDAAQRTSAMLLTTAALQQVDGQLPDAQTQKLLLAAWQEVSEPIHHP